MAKMLAATDSPATATPHSGGMLVALGDGSVRNVSPSPPAGPVPIPYPNIEATTRAAGDESGDYLLTSVSHAGRDSLPYEQGNTPDVASDFLFGETDAEGARHFNGFVSRFSAGGRDAYEGTHALYQDVVIPTGQVHDGTSNTILFAEIVIRPSSGDGDFTF